MEPLVTSGNALPEQARPRPLVSVVVPCLNEENNVRPLYERLVPTMERAAVEFELIFSCDPCTDRS